MTTLDFGMRSLTAAHEPVVDGTVERARGEQGFVHRMPNNLGDILAVPSVRADFLQHSQIPNLERLILRPGHEPVSILVPLRARHRILVPVHRRRAVPALGVPEFHRAILASRRDESEVRMPLCRLHIPRVPAQRVLRLCSSEIYNPNRRIVARRREFEIRTCKRDIRHRFLVHLKRSQVVERRLKVLDVPFIIPSEQPIIVIAKRRASNRSVVRLQNGFKVERHSVPKREFAVL